MIGARALRHLDHEVRPTSLVASNKVAHSLAIHSSVVREIQRINDKELDLALNGASWHDEYKGRHSSQVKGPSLTASS
jgi:hypothetical protein